MNWYVCDHRAPAVLPRKTRDPEVIGIPLSVGGVMLVIGDVVAGVAADTPVAVTAVFASLSAVWAWYAWQCKRWIFRIPGNGGLISANETHTSVRQMQSAWRDHPDLRSGIEPVLIASYRYAREGESRPVEKRARAVADLVRLTTVRAPPEDTSDLDELQRFIERRRTGNNELL